MLLDPITVAQQKDIAWEQHRRQQVVDQRVPPHEGWTDRTRNRLAGEQNWQCCYCGCRLHKGSGPNAATLERIIPVALGGDKFDEDNLAVACWLCNHIRDRKIWPAHIDVILSGAIPRKPVHDEILRVGPTPILRPEFAS